jgi:hypothetical protein
MTTFAHPARLYSGISKIILWALLIGGAGLIPGCGRSGGTSAPTSAVAHRVPQGTTTAFFDAPSSVMSYANVTLEGTLSGAVRLTNPSYKWQQTAGPLVALNGATNQQVSFTAPKVSADTTLTFKLTVTDAKGFASSHSESMTVSPASALQLTPTFVGLRFLRPDPDDPQGDPVSVGLQPLAGGKNTIEATLSGAVVNPSFSLVDSRGKELGPLKLSLAGDSWVQPLKYVGTMTTPNVPFQVAASGTTGDGQKYALSSPTVITPTIMTVAFAPSKLTLAPGARAATQLIIYNAAASAVFTVQFADPEQLLSKSGDVSVQVAQGNKATVPVSVGFPASLKGNPAPQLTATASVAGDPTRNANATLTVWRDDTP